jgi:23S rRNA U2552 (ribose-2'-O)-methylase RlmE/FtsJ
MEKQATKVQQGYRDNAAFKLKQIKENENNGHQ